MKPIRFHRPNSFQGGPLCLFFLLQHPYSGVPNFLPIPILIVKVLAGSSSTSPCSAPGDIPRWLQWRYKFWPAARKGRRAASRSQTLPARDGDGMRVITPLGLQWGQKNDHSYFSKPIPFLRVDNYDNSSPQPINFHQQSKRHKQCPSITCKQEPAAAALPKK